LRTRKEKRGKVVEMRCKKGAKGDKVPCPSISTMGDKYGIWDWSKK
jgi:hypothetical protein